MAEHRTAQEKNADKGDRKVKKSAAVATMQKGGSVCRGTALAGSNSLAIPAENPYPLAKGWQRGGGVGSALASSRSKCDLLREMRKDGAV